MGNLSLNIPLERPIATPSTKHGVVCVASFGDPIARDYANYVGAQGSSWPRPLNLTREAMDDWAGVDSIVLFLKPKLSRHEQASIESLLRRATDERDCRLCIVGTFRVHLNDARTSESESHALRTARRYGFRPTVIRAGHVLSDRSAVVRAAGRWGALYPLVPSRLRSCFIIGIALFGAIEQERAAEESRRSRTHTLLGQNLPVRQVLASHRSTGGMASLTEFISSLLAWLLVGEIVAAVTGLLSRFSPAARSWNVQTLQPRTFRELRSLYGPYNYRHVKVVGYNNGVNHFGHRYPGRTIVSTVRLNRVVPAGADVIRADCGATVRKARDVVGAAGQDLPVIPNYSYVSLGTAYFVPIHGSASDYSCIAQTITRVVVYDPTEDRLIVADHDSPEFGRRVYDAQSEVLLLRLYCRVKPKSAYFLRMQEVDAPAAADLLDALRDKSAANVEVRKSSASGSQATIYRYYTSAAGGDSAAIAVARDSIGKLWDRLEENPITSFLMHRLTRHLAFHVELFFTAEQFERFWETHRGLPLRKIQLRYIRSDRLSNSPFCNQDCISSDMFMFRRRRGEFERYLERTFGPGAVRANPGKHSY